jgi:hypothetical protein
MATITCHSTMATVTGAHAGPEHQEVNSEQGPGFHSPDVKYPGSALSV